MKGTRSEARARALALAAVRETFEEAGLLIGTPLGAGAAPKAPTWQDFFATGFRPALGRLTFFARAITPPGRPRRFDTRFFCVPAEAIVHRVEDRRTASCRTSNGTRSPRPARSSCPTSRASCWRTWASASPPARCTPSDFPVPFYHRRNGSFRRDLIGADADLD